MSKPAPIVIPPDVLAKYEGQTGQFEAFDAAFRTVMHVPASSIPPPVPEGETPKRGRPRKKGA